MQWTEAQREAIETRRQRVLVSAGAGSGKTRVLVERFLRLLEENPSWNVPDIVAVTFTEKAAREMVSRIRREIRQRIEAAESLEARERWRAHRNALDSARIGTIHSLCAALLRAHPAEARIDPAFTVLEEIEADMLLEQAIEATLAAAARESRPSALSLIDIFSYLSAHEVEAALTSLVRQGAGATAAMARLEDKTPADIFTEWQQSLREAREAAARALVESDEWRESARAVARLAALDATDKIEQVRAEVAARLAEINDSPDAALPQRLLDIRSVIVLRGGSAKKWPSQEALGDVKDALTRMRDLIKGEALLVLELNDADRAAAEVAARLAELYRRTRQQFAALKRSRSALDFNDLEELTERMLATHEEICKRYHNAERGLIRALMVDEFQDTAPIQTRILKRLAPQSGEFFIIGDAKQSIYRFRGADLTVFHEIRDGWSSSGGRDVSMNACFRTHERLIAFVNHLFHSIFRRENRYDTDYEAMTAHRRMAADAAAVELHIITQSKDAGEKLKAGELREREAALVARRFREIVERETLCVCDRDDRPRPAQYGDFALLFQASTSFDLFEQALADANVPYVTIAGRGFYDRQEITDLTNLLRFLVSPNDNLSLAAVLRSPIFALSDETLLRLRSEPPRRTLWRALCDEKVEHTAAEGEAVRAARDVLARLRARAGRVSTAELIVEALRATGYLATLMRLPHGERRVANVEKFIEQARALASMTLAELVERVGQMQFREAREGEATVEEAGAVRLMTVHKSKGLEFPIVWLVDATYKGRVSRDLIATHVDYGIAVRIGADHLEPHNDLQAASYVMFQEIEQQMDRAEKKRLLYVAATRARDHLMISAAPGMGSVKGDHWLGRVLSSLGIDDESRPTTFAYPGGEVAIHWHDADTIPLTEASRQPAAAHVHDSSSSTEQPDDKLFPLIGPLI
ncbi:MAG TPA: UvrD-helicase domain-containing protein [Blastocatellia bacterium]|nr:UvrD-helicase domain-containing protein [Blastocatellia bacterium]